MTKERNGLTEIRASKRTGETYSGLGFLGEVGRGEERLNFSKIFQRQGVDMTKTPFFLSS